MQHLLGPLSYCPSCYVFFLFLNKFFQGMGYTCNLITQESEAGESPWA